jgi:tRNA threonylcarbamoyladenosine biosynthesis protein TsaB
MASAGVEMAELDEVVLSDGPGSFTSLRVGAATAKGLCMALPGLKLRVVPTLLALGLASEAGGLSLATINSRRGEVYGQLFSEYDPLTEVFNVKIVGPDPFLEVLLGQGQCSVNICGQGQERLSTAKWLEEPVWASAFSNGGYSTPRHCSASYLLAPASAPEGSRLVDVATYEPFYLNPPFVTVSKKKPLG